MSVVEPGAADAAMFSARMILWFEAREADALRDTHALTWRFAEGTRLVDLSQEPTVIQAHVTTGFLRREVLLAHGIRFRERLRLRFEDGNLVSRYLLQFDAARKSFEKNVAFTRRLVDFALSSPSSIPPRLLFTSSIGALRSAFINLMDHLSKF